MVPIRIRFRLHESDHERYGSDAWVYDEAEVARLPIREQIEIEREIERELGYSLPVMMRRLRGQHVDAMLAATWVARRMAGIREPLADYAPAVMLAEWLPEEDDADPPDGSPESTSSPPTTASTRSSTSGSRGRRR